MSDKWKLGDIVKDRHTGFEGLAVARTDWLYGCTRVGIECKELSKDGEPIQPQWFDIQRVILVKKQVVENLLHDALKEASEPPGGPKADPSRRADY